MAVFVVPAKGDCEYAIRRGAQDVNKILGYNKMIFKGDQEPALRKMMDRMKMLCGDQCTLDETPVGDSQSNGSVESTIKQIQGQFRTMRGALETRYGKEINPKSNSMSWLVRHAGSTLFRERKRWIHSVQKNQRQRLPQRNRGIWGMCLVLQA